MHTYLDEYQISLSCPHFQLRFKHSHNSLPFISTCISSGHLKINIYKTKLFLQSYYWFPPFSNCTSLFIFIFVDTKICNSCKSFNVILNCRLFLFFYILLFSSSSQFAFIIACPSFFPSYYGSLEPLIYTLNYYNSILH